MKKSHFGRVQRAADYKWITRLRPSVFAEWTILSDGTLLRQYWVWILWWCASTYKVTCSNVPMWHVTLTLKLHKNVFTFAPAGILLGWFCKTAMDTYLSHMTYAESHMMWRCVYVCVCVWKYHKRFYKEKNGEIRQISQRFPSHDITQSFHNHVLSTCHKKIAQTSSKSVMETWQPS